MDSAVTHAVELLRKVHVGRLHGNIQLEGQPPRLTSQLSADKEEPFPSECKKELISAIKLIAKAYGGDGSVYLNIIAAKPPTPYMELMGINDDKTAMSVFDLVHSVCATLTQKEFDERIAKENRVVFSKNPVVVYDVRDRFVQIGDNVWRIL